jgi:predicted phage-related endonuclease
VQHNQEFRAQQKPQGGTTMTTIETISKAARDYRELQTMIKELEAEADAIKAVMISEMEKQNTDTLKTDIFTIRWTAYNSSRVDTSALKKELPEIAARYTKTTEARRFQIQ